MSPGMLCAFWNIHNMKDYECKMCPGITQLVLENRNGGKGQTGRKKFTYLWGSAAAALFQIIKMSANFLQNFDN
jgi:hypothetical protein